MTHVLLPYAVLSLYAVMRRIYRLLLDAAAICGARSLVAFAQVYLPLSMPGVAVAASPRRSFRWFLHHAAAVGSPRNALLSQLIYTDVAQRGDTASAAALGMILLLSTLVLLLVFAVVARRPAFRAQGVSSDEDVAAPSARRRRSLSSVAGSVCRRWSCCR